VIRVAFTLLLALTVQCACAADMMKGGQLYRMHCASCHGASGISTMPNVPSFARGERMTQPDQMLLGSIRRGRGAMPGFFGVLSDRDTLDVIAYMRSMR